jgi:hypothetical protein
MVQVGREKELAIMRDVTKRIITSHSRSFALSSAIKSSSASATDPSTPMNIDEQEDRLSSKSDNSQPQAESSSPLAATPRVIIPPTPTTSTPSLQTASAERDNLRRAALASTKSRVARAHAIVVYGPAG